MAKDSMTEDSMTAEMTPKEMAGAAVQERMGEAQIEEARHPDEDRRRQWIDPEEIGIEERRRILRRQEERERWERFAQFVGDRRRALGRSQATCADDANLSPTKWNRIENAQFTVPITVIADIAKALDADPDDVYRAAGFAIPKPGDLKKSRDQASRAARAPATMQEVAAIREQLNRIERMLGELLGELRR